MGAGVRAADGEEEGAIRRLVAEIDSVDAWRDRVGKRILAYSFLLLRARCACWSGR